jgi:hypothetical protein
MIRRSTFRFGGLVTSPLICLTREKQAGLTHAEAPFPHLGLTSPLSRFPQIETVCVCLFDR